MEFPPPGWHIDPDDPNQLRFWGGDYWTNYYHPLIQERREDVEPKSIIPPLVPLEDMSQSENILGGEDKKSRWVRERIIETFGEMDPGGFLYRTKLWIAISTAITLAGLGLLLILHPF